jgi:DNA primase
MASMASGDAVQQVKERLSILDVVAPYVELHKAGKSYKGKSPFTNEKTPSFYVSPERGMYYCFSSNQGGDIFTFIERMEGVDFKGALKLLAEKAGVELVREDPKKRTERDTQYALIEEAAKFFFTEGTNNAAAQEYVERRGVDGKSIHLWRIGFAPDGWRNLKEHLAGKGYTEAQMLRAGLIKKSDEAKEPYDVFRNRIMFPICDNSGRVVAFSGRTLSKDAETPKYVNSPETELYNKSEILFGYDKAKQGIRSLDFSLVVEGQFDLVLAHQAGYGNTVAVSGTALTPYHVGLLERLSNRAVLALDSDRAGIAAIKRAAGLMLVRGMDVKVVTIEGGKDPADIIKDDPKKFRKMVGESKHVVEFLLGVLEADSKDERAYKLRVREELIPVLARMPNKIDREHFEGVLAEALSTTKDGIHYEVERVAEKNEDTPVRERPEAARVPDASSASPNRLEIREQYLFAAMRFVGSFEEGMNGVARIETILKDALGDGYAEKRQTMTDEALNKDILALEGRYESYPPRDFFDDLAGKLSKYKKDILTAKLSAKKAALQELERAGETGKAYEKLLGDINVISKKIADTIVETETIQ